ncbi:hypothetical protein BDR22DRAFT_858375 [Usnea florida]
MPPSLTTIPPEIHGLIGSHLCIRDINRVSRTCKALKDAFLASLYENVVIRAPIQWSRLVSLENLISSAGSGLKFTTSIYITTQQQPSKNNTQENENDSTTLEDLAGSSCLPQASASKTLNVLVRLLLGRIPDNQLKCFDYRHKCSLELSTLALLFSHQSNKLRAFNITRYPEPQNVPSLLLEGLRYLSITDLNIDQKCEWPSRLIMHNRNTLKHLSLGISSTIAQCPIHDRWKHRLPTSFAETTHGSSPASESATEILSLEKLALIGLNLEDVIGGELKFKIDFKVLTGLKMESCSNLNKAFTALIGKDNSTLSELKLTSFLLRHEGGDPAFAQNLTLFLTSFTGLKHLSLLIEGQTQAMSKGPILEMHGKTLRTLVWDERSGPRKMTKSDTALFLNDNGLSLISQKCPNLYALGLCVRWGPCNSDESTTASPTVKIIIWHPLGELKLNARRINGRRISRTYPVDCQSFERCTCAICQILIRLHLTSQ